MDRAFFADATYTQNSMKKEIWTENEICSIAFESDKFERKSGSELRTEAFNATLAKALSAFANSEGGHILLGVRDDGTFDGVDPVIKGNAKTVDWLGQKIADLVSPSLSSMRIHHVVAAADGSKIPEGKILVVIDVERSILAPHQSNKDHHYYYRVDRESKPAPHRYVESLFGRQKFPSPSMAKAWVQSVINPILNDLWFRREMLEAKNWGFDLYRKSITCVREISQQRNSGNFEQFFTHYSQLFSLVVEHDLTAQALNNEVINCHSEMTEIALALGLYRQITSVENLMNLKDGSVCHESRKFADCRERDEFIRILFQEDDEEQNTKLLIAAMINRRPEGNDFTFAPLWNLERDGLLAQLTTIYGVPLRRLNEQTEKMLAVVSELFQALSEERHSLCFTQGLPFEELHPSVSPIL